MMKVGQTVDWVSRGDCTRKRNRWMMQPEQPVYTTAGIGTVLLLSVSFSAALAVGLMILHMGL